MFSLKFCERGKLSIQKIALRTSERCLANIYRFLIFHGADIHPSGALELVPGKALALDRAFDGLEQHHGEQLPICEPLQPYLAEQPDIFASFGLAALQGESQCGSDEINHQKCGE